MKMRWRRFLVQFRRNQLGITVGITAVALVIVFQNCGRSPVDVISGGGFSGAWVVADISSHQFPSALLSPDVTVTFTATREARMLSVTDALPNGFLLTNVSCTPGTTLSAGSSCTVRIRYRNCSPDPLIGYVSLGYLGSNNQPGQAVVVDFTGVAGVANQGPCAVGGADGAEDDG